MIVLEGTSGILNRSGCIKDKQFWLPQATPGLEEGLWGWVCGQTLSPLEAWQSAMKYCLRILCYRLVERNEVKIEPTSGMVSPVYFHFFLTLTYIVRYAGLEETQAGIKIARRNINNLRYADDTTLMAESEEELKSLLMKVRVKKLA